MGVTDVLVLANHRAKVAVDDVLPEALVHRGDIAPGMLAAVKQKK
jgi:hypothetical protein